MKQLLIVFALLSAACNEKPDINPSPCADIKVDSDQFTPAWSAAVKTDAHPIFFEGQIIFVEPLLSGNESNLNCFDAISGAVKWQKTLPEFLLGDEVKLKGSKLYYVGQKSKALRAFDLHTLEDMAVATIETEGYFDLDIAMQNNYAIISDINASQTSDSVQVNAYLINLQDGAHRRILSYPTGRAAVNGKVINDPVTEIIPNGDTLYCFIELVYDPSLSYTSFRLVSLNLGNDSLIIMPLNPSTYAFDFGNLMLLNGIAYFAADDGIYAVNALSSKVIWKKPLGKYFYGELALHAGKLIAYDRFNTITALNPTDGESEWVSSFYVGATSVMAGNSVVQDNNLYFLGDFSLSSLDLETGCLASRQNVSDQNLLPHLAKSADGKMFYLCSYDSLIALKR